MLDALALLPPRLRTDTLRLLDGMVETMVETAGQADP